MHSVIGKVTRIVSQSLYDYPYKPELTPEREEMDQMHYPAHRLGCPPYLFHLNFLQYWSGGGNPENDPIV